MLAVTPPSHRILQSIVHSTAKANTDKSNCMLVTCVRRGGRACYTQTSDAFQPSRLTGVRLNNCVEWYTWVFNELVHCTQWFNGHLFQLADSRSCGLHGRSVGHAWLHRWVIDTLSHCRQCGRHGQYECQRGVRAVISLALQTVYSERRTGGWTGLCSKDTCSQARCVWVLSGVYVYL